MIATQTAEFSDDKSYFVLRQVENIKSTGIPLYNDDLSYGGRFFLFSPISYYILGFIYFIIPKTVALKIFLNLAATSLIFATYLISYELIKNKKLSILTAFVSGFIPIYFQETVNSLSIFSILLPSIFFTLYYLIKLNKDKKFSNHFITFMVLSILISPLSIILILGLLFYMFLSRIEKIKIPKFNLEIILVSTFLYVWFNFLLYKRAILFHGQKIIWQNIPKTYFLQYFLEINILQSVYLIGITPFLLGIYAGYVHIAKQRASQPQIILGLAMSLLFLLWFKLIPLIVGLIFLGSVLTILLSLYFKLLFSYISKTKVHNLTNLFFMGFILLIIITSVVPSIALGLSKANDVPAKATIDAFLWIKQETTINDTVLVSETEGHSLSYFSKRKNVIDDNYLFINKIDQRLEDVRRIYVTRFSQEAYELSKKYGIDYVVIDDKVKENYEVESLFYSSKDCFPLIYDKNVKIYKVECGK